MIQQDCDLVCADAMHFGASALEGQTFMEAFMGSAPASGEYTYLNLISAERSIITSGVLARRQPILEAGSFDEALRNSQDFDLWLRLARQGRRLAFQRKVLLHYRFHENSLSGDEINRTTRQLRVLDKIEDSSDFQPDERTAILKTIGRRRASLEYELGKLYLDRGEFGHARDSFAKANASQPSWKTQIAVVLSRLAPGVLSGIRRSKAGMNTKLGSIKS
jgi:hypothetical protein